MPGSSPYKHQPIFDRHTQVNNMEMVIDFPGGARVDAHFGSFTVPTDQPPMGGGRSSAPTPFATFLASIGTCAGIYVLGFCRQRGLSAEGMKLVQSLEVDPYSGLVSKVQLDIQLPPDFPEKYRGGGRPVGGAVRRQEALRAPASL
jgi:ribosomal protein S12 methylthiotransferase accessory factor